MTSQRAAEAAAILAAARRDGRLIEPLPDACRPRSIAEGYEVQSALRDIWPDSVAGWKIGAEFVVGYGMDAAERFRNLPYVGVLEEA